MATRRKSKRTVRLPWEDRGHGLQRLLGGSRWKVALLLLAVLGVVAIFYRYADRHNKERITRIAIDDTHRAIADFRAQIGRCPRTVTELVHPPRARTRYLRQVPRDGWGRPLQVRCPALDDPTAAEVVSLGPSGRVTIEDNLR